MYTYEYLCILTQQAKVGGSGADRLEAVQFVPDVLKYVFFSPYGGQVPENVAHYLASMPVTSVPAHKTPQARMITCMLSTTNKRRWNVGVDPFMFASLFTKVALSEKTDDAGCDGSERLKQIKAIGDQYNQKYRPMPSASSHQRSARRTSWLLLSHFFVVAERVIANGGHVCFEWPKGSRGWILPELVCFFKMHGCNSMTMASLTKPFNT